MKYNMSDIGLYMLKVQEDLANQYQYKILQDDLAIKCMRQYVLTLPIGFHLEHDEIPVFENPEINRTIYKPGYEIVKEHKIPIVSRDGTMIAYKYNRIVIGHYGAFIEIDDSDIYDENICIKSGEQYRVFNKKYKDKVKYQWYTAKDSSNCKLYKQMRQVSYADYQAEMWYVSPFEVLDLNELKQMFAMKGDET